MKKLLLILILVVVSSSAMAEWVEIGEDEEKTFTLYADPDTIQKTGNIVKIWSLHDYRIDIDNGVASAKGKVEHDCKEKKSRIHFVVFYSGHLGNGETVLIHSEPGASWQQPTVGSVAEILLEFACSFRPKMPETFPEETFS